MQDLFQPYMRERTPKPAPRPLDIRSPGLLKSSHNDNNRSSSISNSNSNNSNNNAKPFAKRECNCSIVGLDCPQTKRRLPTALAARPHLHNLDLGACVGTPSKDYNNPKGSLHPCPQHHQHEHQDDEQPDDHGAYNVLNPQENNDENCGPRGSHRWNLDSLSFAKHCQMKLESLLNVASTSNDELPDAQRTKACFQVLEELCESKLPFSSFLNHICGELKRCLYQSAKCKDNFSKQKEGTYFELAEELKQEISQMETSNSFWKSRLLEEEKDLQSIRSELQDLREEIIQTDHTSNELEENISIAMRVLSLEEKKVNGLHEKIKSLKQELKDIKREVKQTQQIDTMKDAEVREYEKLKANYMQCVHEFQHVQGLVRACQSELTNSVPKAEVIAAKAEVLELSDKVYEAKTGVDAFTVATRPLTPRPQWGGEMPGMDKPYGVSTAQQVERICKENAFLTVNISRFQLGFAASEATLAQVKDQEINKGKSSKKDKAQGNANAKKKKEKLEENATVKTGKTRTKSQEKKKKKKA